MQYVHVLQFSGKTLWRFLELSIQFKYDSLVNSDLKF